MRIFEHCEPDEDEFGQMISVIVRKTEKEIEEQYFPYWKTQMLKKYPDGNFDGRLEDAIEDWQITNWAQEVKEETK